MDEECFMRMYARVLAASGVVLALGVCLLSAVGLGRAADDKEKKDIIDAVNTMADTVQKRGQDRGPKGHQDGGKKSNRLVKHLPGRVPRLMVLLKPNRLAGWRFSLV